MPNGGSGFRAGVVRRLAVAALLAGFLALLCRFMLDPPLDLQDLYARALPAEFMFI